jgi:hypothetical protein
MKSASYFELGIWTVAVALLCAWLLAGCVSFTTFNLTVNDYRATSQPETP